MFSSGMSSRTTVTTSYKKTGTYSLGLGDLYGEGYFDVKLDSSLSRVSISAWIYLRDTYNHTDYTNRRTGFQFYTESGEYIYFRWNGTTHTFDLLLNSATVITEPGTITITENTWFHVQIDLLIDTVGTAQVKLNGHLSLNYSGDTQPGTSNLCSSIRTSFGAGGVYDTDYMDDFVIGTNGFLGDLRCPDIRPTADTAQDDWTPSAGDNYSTVDEISTTPATIDADYNKAGLDGDADELALGDFDGATYVPVAVTAWCRAQQLAANGDSIKIGIDSGGTDDVTEWPLSNTMEYYFHTADQNPADAAEWEDADIDALLVRYEAVIV